jgi:hypothetical protein
MHLARVLPQVAQAGQLGIGANYFPCLRTTILTFLATHTYGQHQRLGYARPCVAWDLESTKYD